MLESLRRLVNKSFGSVIFPAFSQLKHNNALRYQDDFKNVIYSNIQDFKARKIIDWLDIDKLWTIHQNKRVDLAPELMILAVLKIHFKAKTINLMDE